MTNCRARYGLVEGVGINDADYVTASIVNGKHISCPFYRCWRSMLFRCYSAKQLSDNPTYVGCEVCEEWKHFMAFKSWMEMQDWKGKQLDKDFIGDGKLYSPENCVFIPGPLNRLLTDSAAIRGEHPIGVSWDKLCGKFTAKVKVNGKKKHLGMFISADDAHKAWLAAKIEIANSYLANESNPRVRYAIECGIAKLK